jgi:hypothetical protein
MTEAEAQEYINKVLKDYPDLTANGFKYENRYALYNQDDGWGKDHGPVTPEGFTAVVEWLLNYDALDRRKTINTSTSSYGWKHRVERDAKQYVSNGDFICGALYLKYSMKRMPRSPNAYFNLRKETSHALHK